MDPHHSGKLDPNPDPSEQQDPDPDPDQSEKQDPNPDQSEKVEALGSFENREGPHMEKSWY